MKKRTVGWSAMMQNDCDKQAVLYLTGQMTVQDYHC